MDEYVDPPAPTPETLHQAEFAQGQAAQHPFGVLYQGEHETLWDGTSVAVRLHARALATTRLPVLLKSFSNVVINETGVAEPLHVVGLDPKIQQQVGALRNTSISTLVPLIKHLVVRDAEHLRGVIYPKGVVSDDMDQLLKLRESVASATILYTVWERDRIDPAVVKHLNRVAECWVPCEDNAAMLRRSGVERVYVIPHPYDPEDVLCRCVDRQVPPNPPRRFYSIGAWQPRKGYDLLLGAFLLAFEPGQDVRLVLKLTGGQWPGYPTPEEALQHWLQDDRIRHRWTLDNLGPHLRITRARVPQPVIQRMHHENNLYVCCSHGEAWCLPAFDAKIAGNRLVHVPYGGTRDFADAEDIAVEWQSGPVHPSYRWETGACWADFTVEQLRDALRAARAPEVFRRSPAFEERFQLRHVGQLMAARVLDVVRRAKFDKASAYLESQVQL